MSVKKAAFSFAAFGILCFIQINRKANRRRQSQSSLRIPKRKIIISNNKLRKRRRRRKTRKIRTRPPKNRRIIVKRRNSWNKLSKLWRTLTWMKILTNTKKKKTMKTGPIFYRSTRVNSITKDKWGDISEDGSQRKLKEILIWQKKNKRCRNTWKRWWKNLSYLQESLSIFHLNKNSIFTSKIMQWDSRQAKSMSRFRKSTI